MQDRISRFFFFLFLFIFSLCFSFPNFIVKSKDFKELKADFKIRLDSYFFIEKLNSKEHMSIVFFNDSNKEIYLVLNNKKKLINEKFLKKEKRRFVYLSRGVFSDGKYIYIYSVVKYGKPKYVVLFRINPNTLDVKYHLFNNPPQALKVRLFADGKGGVLLTWQDEDKMPYRMAWVYSEDYMETPTYSGILSGKYGIALFEPIILKEKPFVIYIKGNKLVVRNLLDDREKELDTLNNPIELRIKIDDGYVWIAVQDDRKFLKIYKLSDFNIKETFTIQKIKLREKTYNLEEFIWSFYDFEVVEGKPIAVITAKFKYNPGVKVNGFSLRDKYNVFVNSGDTFYLVNKTLPFLIYYTFPSIASDGNSWVLSYFGRKFIKGNVFLSLNGSEEKSDIAVEPPFQETGFPKIIAIEKNYYRLLYPIREGNEVYLKSVDVLANKLEHYYKLPPKDVLEKKLRERINKFIKCQEKNDLDCILEIMDPVSREYVKRQPKTSIKVLSYEYTKIKLIENSPLAAAEGYSEIEIPPGAIPGINKKTKKKVIIQDVWAYIDDQWYYVPPVPLVGYYLKW